MSDAQDDRRAGAVNVAVDGEGALRRLAHHRIREGMVTDLLALPHGMEGGRASVAVVGRLKDGSRAVLQTSMRIMLGALHLWLNRYGLEADGESSSSLNEITRRRLNAAMMLALLRDREGQEASFHMDDLNAVMQDVAQDFELVYGDDGKTLTIRATRSS